MATPDKPGKAMSSRLMTMKFMQRGAASSTHSAPSTPESRPSKRPRLSEPHGRYAQKSRDTDVKAIQDAQASEELKRQQTLDRQATDAGDSKWTLNLEEDITGAALKIINAGYTMIDSPIGADTVVVENGEVAGIDHMSIQQGTGRKSFGAFNKTLEKQQHRGKQRTSSHSGSDGAESLSGSKSESELESSDHETQRKKRSHAQGGEGRGENKKARRVDERQASDQRAERRRHKEVKLKTLKSVSSGGGKSAFSQSDKGSSRCYSCGNPGHKKFECPNNAQANFSSRRLDR